ncbi:MAG: hypothetical protein BGO78_02970 [Chloroflexi bacterium 44-23]|nr:MAG: hypothetical protein BGO78_02970 [Chloroflexi bacterium 44-23]
MSKTGKWISGLVLGGLIGGGIALLTASRSGEETRDLIGNKTIELREKAVDKVNEVKHSFGEAKDNILDDTKEKVGRLKKVGRSVLEQQSELIQEGKKQAKEAVSS